MRRFRCTNHCAFWGVVAPLIVTAAVRATAPAGWSQLAPYPIPITNNAVTSVCNGSGCTIYSFMGMTTPTDPNSVTAASYSLASPGTGPWIRIADAPLLNGKAKIGASAVACGGDVYLIGGYTIGGAEVTENRLFRYDPIGDGYIERSNVGLTEVDDTVASCYRNRYVYLASGWHGPDNANTNKVQFYDTVSDTWQQATPVPIDGRFGHTGGLVGDRLVFIDGAKDTFQFAIVPSTLVGEIDPSDPTSITWSQPSASPFSQTYRAAGSQGSPPCDQIIFVGGTDNSYNFSGTGYNGQPSNALDQVLVYDPASDVWALVDDSADGPHTPTMDHRGLVGFDGKWVTVGGMTGPGAATTAVNALSFPLVCPSEGIPAASTWGLVVVMLALLAIGTAAIMRRRKAA